MILFIFSIFEINTFLVSILSFYFCALIIKHVKIANRANIKTGSGMFLNNTNIKTESVKQKLINALRQEIDSDQFRFESNSIMNAAIAMLGNPHCSLSVEQIITGMSMAIYQLHFKIRILTSHFASNFKRFSIEKPHNTVSIAAVFLNQNV